MRWRLAFSQPCRTVQQHAQALRRWRHFECIGIRVHALRELHAEALDAGFDQLPGQLRSGFVARLVAVIRDVHALDAVPLERGPMVLSEAVHAVTGRHIAVARAPKGQRIDQRLAQDDVLRRDQRLFVPYAPMIAGKIQVQGRSLAQARRDLPSVHLHHVTGWRNHRDNQRAVEMLVAALPVDAQLLQPRPYRCAGDAILGRKAQPQRSVGEAQPEPLHHLRRVQAARSQIAFRLRRLVERVLIEAHDLQQQFPVPSLRRHRRGQLPHRALLHWLDRTCS